MAEQTIYDGKRDGHYRDRAMEFMIQKEVRNKSMTSAHYHPYYEIFYVTMGNCRMFVGHSLFTVSPGEMVILPPSTLHRTQYDEKIPVERTTVSFTPKFIDGMGQIVGMKTLEESLCMGKVIFNGQSRERLEVIFENLLFEDKINDKFSEAAKKTLLSELFVCLARNGSGLSEEKLMNETEANIQDAAKHIFEHYSEEITLKEASSIAGMSETYFSKKFREVTGFGFKEYLTNIRMQHAINMLTSGDLTITEIAIECGFPDANYFGDTFKKRTGMSPRDFRRNPSAGKL
ncbi:AraC family transcriptional regulator [Treponema zioleckii]|uniref:AraC family transcriptional regulator n=1 Tax=Treponema zioleckii TaxID=331680 RepID=UPI00168A5FBD|nr:AraC family transcriptional regulator [Treponema zioleckii]